MVFYFLCFSKEDTLIRLDTKPIIFSITHGLLLLESPLHGNLLKNRMKIMSMQNFAFNILFYSTFVYRKFLIIRFLNGL